MCLIYWKSAVSSTDSRPDFTALADFRYSGSIETKSCCTSLSFYPGTLSEPVPDDLRTGLDALHPPNVKKTAAELCPTMVSSSYPHIVYISSHKKTGEFKFQFNFWGMTSCSLIFRPVRFFAQFKRSNVQRQWDESRSVNSRKRRAESDNQQGKSTNAAERSQRNTTGKQH